MYANIDKFKMGSLYYTKKYFNEEYFQYSTRTFNEFNELEKIMINHNIEKLKCHCGHKAKEETIIDKTNRTFSYTTTDTWNGSTIFVCPKNICDFFVCPKIHNIKAFT